MKTIHLPLIIATVALLIGCGGGGGNGGNTDTLGGSSSAGQTLGAQNGSNRWLFHLDYSGPFGSGTMDISNLEIDCANPYGLDDPLMGQNCGEADEGYENVSITYGGNLYDDSGLHAIFVALKGVEVNMMGLYDEQIGGDLYTSPIIANGANDSWTCHGTWGDSYVEKLKNSEAFEISTSGITSCTFSFTPCDAQNCQESVASSASSASSSVDNSAYDGSCVVFEGTWDYQLSYNGSVIESSELTYTYNDTGNYYTLSSGEVWNVEKCVPLDTAKEEGNIGCEDISIYTQNHVYADCDGPIIEMSR